MTDRMEFKFASDGVDEKTGAFVGYGAVFGNVDTHGDVIEPGAFKASLAEWGTRGSLPAMKMMHGSAANPFTGSDLPIGVWTSMREDERGLRVEGKLSGLNTDRGRFNYALMQDGALNGLSIGYKAVRVTRGASLQIKRSLASVKLLEVSLVPQGSNDQAMITDLKSILDEGKLPSVRQFEEFLRDAGGFSKSLAAAIACKATPHLRGDPEASADDELGALFSSWRG
jgi:HK97 family phage prohead protease